MCLEKILHYYSTWFASSPKVFFRKIIFSVNFTNEKIGVFESNGNEQLDEYMEYQSNEEFDMGNRHSQNSVTGR